MDIDAFEQQVNTILQNVVDAVDDSEVDVLVAEALSDIVALGEKLREHEAAEVLAEV